MRRRHWLVVGLLALVVVWAAACGADQSGGGATSASPATKTLTGPGGSFAMAYDQATLPTVEQVSATRFDGPRRPANWSGFYANHLLLSSAAGEGRVTNIGLVDGRQSASGVFVSESRRDASGTVASQIEAMGQGLSNLLVAGDVFSPGPTPTPVTIGGLDGFKVVVPSRNIDRGFNGIDPGLLKHTTYVVYGLFGHKLQYAIVTFAPDDRADRLQPALDAAVDSFKPAP
jgi:hypothetical protein